MGKFFPREDKNEHELKTKNATIGDSPGCLQSQKEIKDNNTEEQNKEQTHKSGSFCEICKKKFRSRYHLKLHSAVHTGEKNYLCGICQKSYQQKWNLITHMARVHGNEKPFQCMDCGKSFGYSSHFKRHIKVHFVEKMKVPDNIKQRILNPHKCEQCQKNFDSNYRLEIHLRQHSRSKPFMCDKCGMSFTTKRLVNNHIAKHHLEDFVCDKCGAFFSHRTKMEQHLIKAHNMDLLLKESESIVTNENCTNVSKKELIPCEVCGKTVMRASMRKHVNIHYRIRVYACRYCKKEFLESGQRMIHERKHTGEKPYICDLCGKGHSQCGNLLAHRKRSHNLKEKLQPIQTNETKDPDLSISNTLEKTTEIMEDKSSRRSEKTTENECTDKAVEEFLKIARTWITKKFEESKAIKTKSPEAANSDTENLHLMERSDSEAEMSRMEDETTNGEESRTEKRSIREKNSFVNEVKKQINNNIFEKILEDLEERDIRNKELIENFVKASKQGGRDSLREFLKVVKEIPDNNVVKSIDGKFFWFCWVCDSKFTSRHILSRHLLIHEPKEMRPYKCDQCHKTFTQSNNYKEHLMSHANQHQFYCEKCGNGFRHKSHFNVHMKKHTETISKLKSKKFECSHCDKTFDTNFHRDEHVRTHTKEKPHLCRICGRQFAAISTLSRHARTHGTAEYRCQICLKLFKQKSSLKRHESIHSENPNGRINCECGKSFSQRPSLKKHKMICQWRLEPVVKPFPCVLCPKRFLTKSDLKRHTATHDTSKNFKCQVCSVHLKTEETYSRHVRRHENVGE